MPLLIEKGTVNIVGKGIVPGVNEVVYDGDYYADDGITIAIVWDVVLENVRLKNTAELLEEARELKHEELISYALSLANLNAYDFIDRTSFITYMKDAYANIVTKNALSSRQLILAGYDAVIATKKAEIDALTTIAAVQAYDVTTGW